MEKKKKKSHIIPTMDGTVTAFSHTFMTAVDSFFVIELRVNDKKMYVMVRQPSQQQLRKRLKMFCCYRLTDLIVTKLRRDPQPIHLATKSSSIVEILNVLENSNSGGPSSASSNTNLITYTGTVTKPIDKGLGIWELDKKVVLVLTFMSNVCGEVWNEYADIVGTCTTKTRVPGSDDTTEASDRENQFVNTYLQVGDHIVLHHIHHAKIKRRIVLAACGRSVLIHTKPRELRLINTIRAASDALLDVVHQRDLGLHALFWLIDIHDHLIKNLCPLILHEKDVRKNADLKGKSIIHNLIEAAYTLKLMTMPESPRSLLREFLFHDECCHLKKNFEAPFSLIRIEDVNKSAVIAKYENFTESKMYNHEFIQLQTPSFVIGQIKGSKSGILQLHDNSSCIDIVILGKPIHLLDEAVVALFNTVVAVEEFSLLENGSYSQVMKKCLVVDVKNIVLLVERPRVRMPNNPVTMQIISKSNVYFKYQNSNDHDSSFKISFIAKAVINQQCRDKNATRETFLHFPNSSAMAYAFYQEGHSYILSTSQSNPKEILNRTYFNTFLSSLMKHFGSSHCVQLPEDVTLLDVLPGQLDSCPLETESIKKLVNGSVQCNKLITVHGVVKDLQFMTPKFDSECSSFPLHFGNRNHIGIPGNKLLRIFIYDPLDSKQEVWLYFCGSNNEYKTLYPLGVWPGVMIEATHVLLKIAQTSGNAYLQATGFTCIKPLSLPVSLRIQEAALIKPDQYLKEGLKEQGPISVIADIICIKIVIIKSVCKGCRSDIVDGQCSYVGCHYPDGGTIDAYAQLTICDGSSTVNVVLKSSEQIQKLLMWREEDFQVIAQEVVRTSEKLSYNYYSKKTNMSSLTQMFFRAACSRSSLNRKMKFCCRKFKNHEEKIPLFFCLDFKTHIPNEDIDIFKERKLSSYKF